MNETLPRQAWMVHPATGEVMDALEAAGGARCARFVGGCVRNAVIGRPVEDIDIATTLAPDAVMAALAAAGIRVAPTGLAHGGVTAIARGRPFEVTTLRRDVETDGRHAVVAFGADWAEDAARRDFRLNALYADREGRIFDPIGEGLADARAGRVVFVGDPERRIEEDSLRILRFFRFLAWYGRGAPDGDGLAACARLAARVEGLSAERVGKEVLRLLAADDPREAVRRMAQAGVLARILPQAGPLARFEALVAIESGVLFESDPVLRLAALLPDRPEAGVDAARRLRRPNAERDRLAAALVPSPEVVSWMSPRETRRAIWRLGVQAFCDRVMLSWAGSDRPAAAVQWRALLPMARTWRPPRLPLDGEAVVAAGVPRGPLVGEVLRAVEAWWVDNDFPDDPLALIERLKAVAQGMAY